GSTKAKTLPRPSPDITPGRPRLADHSAGVAVRVAGRVTALEPGLVDPQAMESVVVREKSDIRDKASGGDVGVKLGHPRPCAVRLDRVVPRRIQRVGDVHPPSVAADLHHLRSTTERQVWSRRVRLSTHNPAKANRGGFARMEWVADVILLEFSCAPA